MIRTASCSNGRASQCDQIASLSSSLQCPALLWPAHEDIELVSRYPDVLGSPRLVQGNQWNPICPQFFVGADFSIFVKLGMGATCASSNVSLFACRMA